METLDANLLKKHVLTDDQGGAIFLFEPEKALVPSEDGNGFNVKVSKDIIDFKALLDELNLDHTVENMLGLIVVLLEKFEEGEMKEYA